MVRIGDAWGTSYFTSLLTLHDSEPYSGRAGRRAKYTLPQPRSMITIDRRRFFLDAGKALGGLALVQAIPTWAFAIGNSEMDLIHRSSRAMGTSIRVSIPKSEFTSTMAERALNSLRRVGERLTVHDENSVLMRMNNSPGQWNVGVELLDVSRSALTIGNLTEGALDVTVLPAMRRYGFVPGTARATDQIDFTSLQVRGASVRVKEDGIGVDFGGIAKGYGVDAAVLALRSGAVTTALIDAGGDLFAMGRPTPEHPWKIGIRHPGKERDLVATVEIENQAVATSGTYVQTRIIDGVKVSHLIDPSTGNFVDHVTSATIVAPDTMTADGLATATSVMRPGAAQDLVERLPGVEGFWIYADGTHYVSSGLRPLLTML